MRQFFTVKKVVDGSVADVTKAVCDRVLPPIADLADRVRRVERAGDPAPVGTVASPGDLKAAFARASAGLLRWPTTVAGGHWLDRPELTALQASLASPEGSVTVVLGPPGSGKSAVLARLGLHPVDGGVAVLAVKADQLRNTIDTAAKLAERLGHQAVTIQCMAQQEPAGSGVV